MKVMHISSAPSWRGGEQQIVYLLEELQKLEVENVVFCPQHTPLSDKTKNLNIQVYTYKKRNLDPRVAKRLMKIAEDEQVDLIHMHDSHSHTYGVMAASLFNCPTPMILSRRVDFPVKRSIFSKWKYNHPRIKKILCVSRAILKILLPDIKEKQKLEVVYSGVNLDRIKPASGKLRLEFEIPNEKLIIGNVASIAPHKDYLTFVETVRKLKSSNAIQPFPKFLIIGGDGGQQKLITNKIHQYGLHDDIILTGFRNDIPEILGELDLMLVTSKEEGLCTSIIDAFKARVPVVATAAGGIPELVLHLQTGLLAPIRDAEKLVYWITKLLNDDALRERMVRKAYVHADLFDKAVMARNTLEFYSSSLPK